MGLAGVYKCVGKTGIVISRHGEASVYCRRGKVFAVIRGKVFAVIRGAELAILDSERRKRR